jgi:molecular chaperone GrpE
MADDEGLPQGSPEADTESGEEIVEEAPTEEHEHTATETQATDLTTVEILAEELEALRARADERDELLDKLQRSRADFINYQKRTRREQERWREMNLQDLVLHLLPVIDDFERALEHAREGNDIDSLTRGFELIKAKLVKALEDHDVVPYDALGQRFDPAYHEAVAHVEKPDAKDQEVIEVLRVGYMMGNRVLRAAQVVVAKGGAPWPADSAPLSIETEEAGEDTEDAPPPSAPEDDGDAPAVGGGD